jgi:two-component system, OmpR family, sensor kinase
VSRLPIRIRLTAAFAVAMVLVLGAMALFVYLRMRADLNDTINTSLRSRSDDAAALVRPSGRTLATPHEERLGESDEGIVQVLDSAGKLIQGTNRVRVPVLGLQDVQRASRGPTFFERGVPSVDGKARILARPIAAGGRLRVVVP